MKWQSMVQLFAICEGNTLKFGDPVSASRIVSKHRTSNCFHMPPLEITTVEIAGKFIGDVHKGGSCNVDEIKYIPHSITHIETSAHILSNKNHSCTIDKVNPKYFSGLTYLMDFSKTKMTENLIGWNMIQKKLLKLKLPITHLAIKTSASLLSQHYDFSDKDFIAIDPKAAKELHEFSFKNKNLNCLILDLPSIDTENDNGKLLAHRNFYGIPEKITEYDDKEGRIIIELAYFNKLKEGYYYTIMTPPKMVTNAVTTDISLYPIVNIDELNRGNEKFST